MKNIKKILISLFASLLFVSQAFALDIGSLKDQGMIGELGNGYIGVVAGNAPSDIKAFVKSINGKRKVAYTNIAKKNGIGLSKAEAIAAKRNFSKTRQGHYLHINGSWKRK